MIISKQFEFEAAHKLPDIECYGKCSQMHGHTYKLIIEIDGAVNQFGWVVNFKTLKAIVIDKVINILDHSYLNELIELPTAENIILWIDKQVKNDIESIQENIVKLKSITLYETSISYAKLTY